LITYDKYDKYDKRISGFFLIIDHLMDVVVIIKFINLTKNSFSHPFKWVSEVSGINEVSGIRGISVELVELVELVSGVS
jgi:hypothetical protein